MIKGIMSSGWAIMPVPLQRMGLGLWSSIEWRVTRAGRTGDLLEWRRSGHPAADERMRTREVQCVCPVPALCDSGHFVGADLVTVVRSSVARLGFDVRKRRHIIAANSIVSNVAVASRTYPRASLLQLHARNARLTARNVRRDLCQPADR